AQRKPFRKELDGSQPRELLLAARFRSHTGRARRRLVVDFDVPRGELRGEIDVVLKFAVLEEGTLHPADEPLYGPFLIPAARRTHLDANAEVDDGLRERRVELVDVAAPATLLHDRAWTVEDGH